MATQGYRRALGQHFLQDESVANLIANTALDEARRHGCKAMLEIGPGQGAITYPITQRLARASKKGEGEPRGHRAHKAAIGAPSGAASTRAASPATPSATAWMNSNQPATPACARCASARCRLHASTASFACTSTP